MKIIDKLAYFVSGATLSCAILLAGALIAQPSESDLMGLGMPGGLAALVGGNADYDIIPAADSSYDLGTTVLEWQDVYVDGTVKSDAVTVDVGPLTVTAGGVAVPAAASLLFTGESGANTACDTTCTLGCIAGWDTGTSVFVACTNAIADTCLCAGV